MSVPTTYTLTLPIRPLPHQVDLNLGRLHRSGEESPAGPPSGCVGPAERQTGVGLRDDITGVDLLSWASIHSSTRLAIRTYPHIHSYHTAFHTSIHPSMASETSRRKRPNSPPRRIPQRASRRLPSTSREHHQHHPPLRLHKYTTQHIHLHQPHTPSKRASDHHKTLNSKQQRKNRVSA